MVYVGHVCGLLVCPAIPVFCPCPPPKRTRTQADFAISSHFRRRSHFQESGHMYTMRKFQPGKNRARFRSRWESSSNHWKHENESRIFDTPSLQPIATHTSSFHAPKADAVAQDHRWGHTHRAHPAATTQKLEGFLRCTYSETVQ